MTKKEIDALAKKREHLPETTSIVEKGLYLALVSIYEAYDAKTMTADEAKEEKQSAFDEYDYYSELPKINDDLYHKTNQFAEILKRDDEKRVKLSGVLAEANKNGCEICKRIAMIYDGRAKE